jgi:hypothetical protein
MEVDYGTASISQGIDMEGTSHATVTRFGLINLLVSAETLIPPINLNAMMIFGAIIKWAVKSLWFEAAEILG